MCKKQESPTQFTRHDVEILSRNPIYIMDSFQSLSIGFVIAALQWLALHHQQLRTEWLSP